MIYKTQDEKEEGSREQETTIKVTPHDKARNSVIDAHE